jgi:non-ribosomal peptide synthetase component F
VWVLFADRQHTGNRGPHWFFCQYLALRSEVRQELSFTELLQQVKTTTLQAYEHGDVPFEKVVEAVVRERDMSRSPLFQVMMVWQNTPPSQPLKLGEVEVIKEAHAHTTAKFDLTLSLKETQHGISGLVEYCTDLFSGQSISRLMAHFTQLLLSLVQTPGEG